MLAELSLLNDLSALSPQHRTSWLRAVEIQHKSSRLWQLPWLRRFKQWNSNATFQKYFGFTSLTNIWLITGKQSGFQRHAPVPTPPNLEMFRDGNAVVCVTHRANLSELAVWSLTPQILCGHLSFQPHLVHHLHTVKVKQTNSERRRAALDTSLLRWGMLFGFFFFHFCCNFKDLRHATARTSSTF